MLHQTHPPCTEMQPFIPLPCQTAAYNHPLSPLYLLFCLQICQCSSKSQQTAELHWEGEYGTTRALVRLEPVRSQSQAHGCSEADSITDTIHRHENM